MKHTFENIPNAGSGQTPTRIQNEDNTNYVDTTSANFINSRYGVFFGGQSVYGQTVLRNGKIKFSAQSAPTNGGGSGNNITFDIETFLNEGTPSDNSEGYVAFKTSGYNINPLDNLFKMGAVPDTDPDKVVRIKNLQKIIDTIVGEEE